MAKNSDIGFVNALARLGGDATGLPDILASLGGLEDVGAGGEGQFNDIIKQLAAGMQSNLASLGPAELLALLQDLQALDPDLEITVDLAAANPAAIAEFIESLDFEAMDLPSVLAD